MNATLFPGGGDDADAEAAAARAAAGAAAPAAGGGGAGGGFMRPAAAASDSLDEVLARLSVVLVERGHSHPFPTLEGLFAGYDAGRTGVVGASDFFRALRQAGAQPPPDFISTLPEAARDAASGGVVYAPFIALVPPPPPSRLISSKGDVAASPRASRAPTLSSSPVVPRAPSPPAALAPSPLATPFATSLTPPSGGGAAAPAKLRRLVLEKAVGRDATALWAQADFGDDARRGVGAEALAAGLARLGIPLPSSDAALLVSLMAGDGAAAVVWEDWSAFFDGGDGGAAKAKVSRRLRALAAQVGAHADALEEHCASQDGLPAGATPGVPPPSPSRRRRTGAVPVAVWKEGLQRCGVLLSDADYAQCAIEIDPAGGGKQLRYAGLADVLRRCAA